MKSLETTFGRSKNRGISSDNLLGFSRMLSTKYQNQRIVPINIPPIHKRPISCVIKTKNQTSRVDITSNKITRSASIPKTINVKLANLKARQSQSCSKPTTALTRCETSQSRNYHSDKNQKKSKKRKRRLFRLKLILPIALVLLVGTILVTVLSVFLTKSQSTTLTTTTTTMTTATSTTSTSTTSTTSTTTTTTITTSTSTTTTETTTTTTTDTTTTTTTDTTTTTSCYFGGDYVNLIEGGTCRISNLKAGYRVWSLSSDGKQLIEDEIMCIGHAAPNTLTSFYTFTTIDGQRISLTDLHFLVTIHPNEKQIKTLAASKVTLEHQLVLHNRTVNIIEIVYSHRIGYYAPITLSGYLLVNNLSTSVYCDVLEASHDFFHQIASPARAYYRLTRWLFGKDYYPFEVQLEEEEIHPISKFIIDHFRSIEFIFRNVRWMIPTIFVIYLTQRKAFSFF